MSEVVRIVSGERITYCNKKKKGELNMKKNTLHLIGILMILAGYICAEEIKPGQYIREYIAGPGDSKYYMIVVDKGDVISILMADVNDPSPMSSASGFYPQVELIEPDGTRTLHWGWDSAEINAKIINTSGTCLIIARESKGTVAGWFGLSVVKNPGTYVNDPEDDPVPILPGEYKKGYADVADLDGYKFYVNAGDIVSVFLGDVNDPFPMSAGSGFWPQVELIEPDGTRTLHWGWDSAEINAKIINSSGTCLIIARESKGTVACNYGLTMQKLPRPDETPTISSLSDEPDPVFQGGTLTLTALDVNDMDGWIVQVDFYRDLNGDGYLDRGGPDQFLGSDTDGQDGWSWSGSIGRLPPVGPNTYFAVAKDNNGLWSDPASTTGEIVAPIPGDINLDGEVNCNDMEIFIGNLGVSGCGEPSWCSGADLDQNGVVDSDDLQIIVENWTGAQE